jgi:predicted ferric reductase
MVLALIVIGGTVWHVTPSNNLFFPITSISIWSLTTIYRLVRIRRSNDGYITDLHSFSHPDLIDPRVCAIKFTVRVPRHLDDQPGRYVYLYFSDLRWPYRFQAHPFMIVWCESGQAVTDLTFLIQPRGGLTARLGRELYLSPGAAVSFDGPYGQDLHLENYDMVMLVAKGIGIAGVLPYARYLTQRKRDDRKTKRLLKQESTPDKDNLAETLHKDVARKVDLFWELELNDQEKWVSEQLRALQDLDSSRVSLPATYQHSS